MLSRFDTLQERDRQTDGRTRRTSTDRQTESLSRVSTAALTRDKNV